MTGFRTFAKIAMAALILSSLSACVAGSEASHHAAEGGSLSELLLGIWHGLIAPITLIGEIIQKVAPHTLPWPVRFYETSNSDILYDVGFFFGLGGGPSILLGGLLRRRGR